MNKGLHIYLLVIFILSIFLQSVHSYSCQYHFDRNDYNYRSWTSCYESYESNIIGISQPGLSNCWQNDQWGYYGCNTWNYDYNNQINFYISKYVSISSGCSYNYISDCSVQNGGCDHCWNSGWYCIYNYHDGNGYAHYYYNIYSQSCSTTKNVAVYSPCHRYCSACSSTNDNNYCTTCKDYGGTGTYKWLNWNDTSYTRCDTWCPSRRSQQDDNAYKGQYISSTTPNTCQWCPLLCSGCQNNVICNTCINTAYLIRNYNNCWNTFPNYRGQCQSDNRCLAACPANLYFPLLQSSTTSASYPWTSGNGGFLTQTNVCYLCHSYCLKCTNLNQFSCTECVAGSNIHRWQNWTDRTYTTCEISCPNRVDDNAFKGQYIVDDATIDCASCNDSCSWCEDKTGGSVCFTCVTSSYLFYNYAQCIATFPNYTNYCYNNNQCINNACPDYLYFQVSKADANTSKYSWSKNHATAYVRQTNICYLCHAYCIKCFDLLATTCTVCRNNAYLIDFQSTCITRFNGIKNSTFACLSDKQCVLTCPADLYFPLPKIQTSNTTYTLTSSTVSTPQAYVLQTNVCYLCHQNCRRCTDFDQFHCSACTDQSYLVDNNAECLLTFPGDSTHCKADKICFVTQCPPQLYFKLLRVNTSNAYYNWTANHTNQLIRQTNICYLCHKYCLQCKDKEDSNCTKCSATFFKWMQPIHGTRCNYYCSVGDYTNPNKRGQFVLAVTSAANRQCVICDEGCHFCATSSSTCYQCMDTHYLLDDYDQCRATFNNAATCDVCVNSTLGLYNGSNGCGLINKLNKQCITACPEYFYFSLNRTVSAALDPYSQNLTSNSRYQYFTLNASVSTAINGEQNGTIRSGYSTLTSNPTNTQYYYRKFTNLCKLCDRRCMKCFGPSNFNCTKCVNNYYIWINSTICQSYCPIGQFKPVHSPYPGNQTVCAFCDWKCINCQGYSYNCSSCQPYSNTSYRGYLYNYVLYNSTCLTSCPTSTNPLTNKGYYGSIMTMVCYPCPNQCSDCNIDPNIALQTQPIFCGDSYCNARIHCSACLQGYALVAKTCVSQTTCREYSYYFKGNGSTTWSPSSCKCLPGYYMGSYISCSRCNISCATCNGPSYTNCVTCDQGYTLSASNTCDQTQIIKRQYYRIQGGVVNVSGSFSNNYYSYTTCGSYKTLLGFQSGYTNSHYLSYSTQAINSINYYGISIKVQILFIDNWDINSGIYVRLGSANNNPAYINGNAGNSNSSTFANLTGQSLFLYDNLGAIGQQQCGTNAFDYVLTFNDTYKLAPASSGLNYSIFFSSNQNPINSSSGYYYMWGIVNAVFSVLKCHDDCATCYGPGANQCKSCSSSLDVNNINTYSKILKNGSCVCDSANNYFYHTATQCRQGCPNCNSISGDNSTSCYYGDYQTSKCVNPPLNNCSSPKLFASPFELSNNYGYCVQYCPSNSFIHPSLMKCTTNCSQFNLSHYNGSSSFGSTVNRCVSSCPLGLILNPYTWWCVIRCPTSYYLKLQNRNSTPECTNKCPTGFQYDNDNTCVLACPVGYFTQTQNLTGHNKCVQKCTDLYGDNITNSCVNFCPSPSIADPTTHLCVKQCPFGYYLQISKANGNRTCVTQCQDGQWLNSYYLNCSVNPKDCPDGTYAYNFTHKCQYSCKNNTNVTRNQVGQNSTRMCQTLCYTGYADWQKGVCVVMCPSNPQRYGFVNGTQRDCVSSCNSTATGLYGDDQANRTCVLSCSALPYSTFGNNGTNKCVRTCPAYNQYGDSNHPYRQCVTVCSSFPNFTYSYFVTKLCLSTCPTGYFGFFNTTSQAGTCQLNCPVGLFGDPTINLCVQRCPYRYFGNPDFNSNRQCVLTCPINYYGMNATTNRICVLDCDNGYWADNYTRLCYNVKTSCSNSTYADKYKKLCVVGTNCTVGTYADPLTMGCEDKCTNSSYFGDNSSNLCVTQCPLDPDYYSEDGKCTATCTISRYADWQANRTCVAKCSSTPIPTYGNSLHRCVNASKCGAGKFGNNNTQLCQPCSGNLSFGDPISKQCVNSCPNTYYGDTVTHLCVLTCDPITPYYADNITNTCVRNCTIGTFGVNSTSAPICQKTCPPNSYALDTTSVCIDNCGIGFFGDPLTGRCYNNSLNCSEGYYGNDVIHMCVVPTSCQTPGSTYSYADNVTKMCIKNCSEPYYGFNLSSFTGICYSVCPQSYYGQNSTRMCLVKSGCGLYFTFADDQNNLCVAVCSVIKVQNYSGNSYFSNSTTYAENVSYTCVEPASCPTDMYAQNISQSCVKYCPYNSTYYSYSDNNKTKRCLAKCFDIFYGQISSGHGICTNLCPGLNYYRDNYTQTCVYVCPSANTTLGFVDTYGDNTTDMCVPQCPPNYFAQTQNSANRTCVLYCAAGTWGNKVTRICVNDTVVGCPSGTWGDDFVHLCVDVCTDSLGGQMYYGKNSTKKCVASCPVPTFAFIATRVCIDICPVTVSNFPGYFGDPDVTPSRLCVPICLTSNLYRDVANNRTCQPSCTYNSTYKTYRDPTTMTCEAECPTYPQYLYAWASNSTNAQCKSSCPTGYMYDDNMSCVATCPNLLDPTTNRCYAQCPFNSYTNITLYANMITKICVTASNCPNNTYASDDLLQCVSTCPKDTYIYLKNCVSFCPDGLYINFANISCVSAFGCPSNYFANNQTRTCVANCTNGTYGDSSTRMCLTQCYGTKFGDPLTGLCSTNCSGGLIQNSQTQTCVGNCSTGFYYNPDNGTCATSCNGNYFANSYSFSCVLKCTSNPMTFASVAPKRECVTVCPSTAKWFDLINRACVANCPNNTYQYTINVSCVSFCPPPYYKQLTACVLNCSAQNEYADDISRTCLAICPTGYYKDPTTFKCVVNCPTSPVKYYVSIANKTCQTYCANNTYADSSKGSCVSQCSTDPLTYAEPKSNTCVVMCPASKLQFADPTTQSCVTSCPTGYYADNRQRKCLSSCGKLFFADKKKSPPSCVSVCTNSTYADPLTYECVSKCSAFYCAYSVNNTCLQFCPYTYFADNSSKNCEKQCTNSLYNYADNLTHLCTDRCTSGQFAYKPTNINYGICLYYCPNNYFSDTTTMTCVLKCPNGWYGQTANNTCMLTCHQSLFKDSINNLCQLTCPSANLLFGQSFTRECVTVCNSTGKTFLYADSLTRLCSINCTGNQYADAQTMKCVAATACSPGTFSDPQYNKCVTRCYNNTYAYAGKCQAVCPLSTLYADDLTQSCVTASNCSPDTFADPSKQKCVQFCDIASNRYANASSHKCELTCAPLFADNITRKCVDICTSVPQYYGYNNICVMNCPSTHYGDPSLNLCVLKCANESFGNPLTRTCDKICPEFYFADDSTNKCVLTCPLLAKYYGDYFTRTCVLNCSNSMYADASHNRQCHQTCNSPLFAQNSTHVCLQKCLTGYADPRTRLCIGICSHGYYGYKFVCYTDSCPSSLSNIVYADDSSNLCVSKCPNGTYGQYYTRKCVKICPISYNQFADQVDRVCTTSCPGNTYADPSVRKCVSTCSSQPALYSFANPSVRVCLPSCPNNLYADSLSRSCSSGCTGGQFADNSTYTCVSYCPSKPMMWADDNLFKCVYKCSQNPDYYADNITRSCVRYCPNNTFADPVSQTCVQTCPGGYYGVTSTWRCQLGCDPLFADQLKHLCVSKCSVDPIFYGELTDHKCVDICPQDSYGNPLTQQCVQNDLFGSTCPTNYSADPISQLCVQVCPMKYNLYSQPFSKICKQSCVPPYVSDNSTMKCVQKCPQYPNYFASNGRCVKYCPNGTYADNSTRVCQIGCPNGTYSQNSTWRCVSTCSNSPRTMRDPYNWKCVSQCSQSFYSDMINLLCVTICPSESQTFADTVTRVCVKVCPNGTYAHTTSRTCVSHCINNTYADNFTRKCLQICPRFPPYFANSFNNSMTCVQTCPNGTFAYDDLRQCVVDCPWPGFYRQNQTKSCVSNCNYTADTYADDATKYCVTNCSNGTFADFTTSRCVSVCPNQPLLYAENDTKTCVSVCPNNSFGDNSTRRCVETCPSGSLSLNDTHLCLFECPPGYYAYEPTQFCLSSCMSPYYGDPSTRSCVLQCPLNQLLFADNSTRTCVYTCPQGSFAFQRAVACLPSCPIATPPYRQTYAADYDNTCVQQCAYPYYSHPSMFKCISTCPNPYFNNLQAHQCQFCPSSCASCTGLTTCLSCNSGYFLQNGECVTNCSLIYYANTLTRTCVLSNLCRPNFGVNSTHTCTSNCITGQFPNYMVYRCDACPPTCISCTSYSNCVSCIANSVSYNNFCYGYCNPLNLTQKYFNKDNVTCTAICPNGTYASVVYCKLCDQICTTCVGTARNCTKCANGLYLLNNVCLTSCPALFKPISTLQCIFCNTTCGQPLTFQTNVTNIDGQTSVYINFNSQVNINGNLYNTFSLTPITRRLQSSLPAGYIIVRIDATTIQIILPPGTGSSNFNVQIVNPQNVQDLNGNLPSSLIGQIMMDFNNMYTTDINKISNGYSVYFTFLSIICLFSILFDLELMHFLQLLYIHSFVANTLPPIMAKMFVGLKFSSLFYLPRLFDIPTAVLRPTVPTTIFTALGDYSFLRNAGYTFTPLLCVLIVWALLKLLTVPEINRFKKLRVWCQQLFDNKFKYAVILEWVFVFMISMVFFAFLQLRDYKIYDQFSQLSLIIAHFVLLFFVVIAIMVSYKVINFHREYPTLSSNLRKATQLILKDGEAEKLVSSNIFLSQKKKIDLRSLLYPKINNQNIFPFKVIYRYKYLALLYPSIFYIRTILLAIFIAIPKDNTLVQMGLSIPLNILCLFYFIRARPFSFKFRKYRIRNYMAIYHQACIIIFEILLFVLGALDKKGATTAEKEKIGENIVHFLIAVCTVSFIYQIFILIVTFYRKIWLIFIESDLFKRNFPEQYALYQAGKIKTKKLAKSIDPKAKQALRNMIKGYKGSKSMLRPNQVDKSNPQLPVKYKLTYFDRTENSSGSSKTSLSKAQKRQMINQIFNQGEVVLDKQSQQQLFEEIKQDSQIFEPEFEEYEEELEINVKDLHKYVANAKELLKNKQQHHEE